MTLLIVRHAEAGDRAAWTGEDHRRPLTAVGRRQAEALVDIHASRNVGRILSSPARRCVETVAPIAADRGMDVLEEAALLEETPFDVIDRLLRRCSSQDVLLCSHGDVIGAVVTALERRGRVAERAGWPKASTWVIDAWPDAARAELLPAPSVG